MYDLLELLIRARYTKQRVELLREANLTLEMLRHHIRLNSYEHAGREVYHIGAMVGGWLRGAGGRA